MTVTCPKCGSRIGSPHINVSTDVASCEACGEIFKLSALLTPVGAENFDVHSPPAGAWFSREGGKTTIGASTRSPMAFFIVPFMIVWSGGSIGGIYGSQLLSGEFDLFLSLFGIPFLLGTLYFGTLAVMTVAGKVEVEVSHNSGRIFTGVGRLGWVRHFDWHDVRVIREGKSAIQYPGGHAAGILLEGRTRIKFATNLNEKRRYFMLSALRREKGLG